MVKQILFDVRAVDHAASLRAAGFDTRAKCRLISIARFGVECPLLAQSRHSSSRQQCPLLGVKRTLLGGAAMSAFDPKRHRLNSRETAASDRNFAVHCIGSDSSFANRAPSQTTATP